MFDKHTACRGTLVYGGERLELVKMEKDHEKGLDIRIWI